MTPLGAHDSFRRELLEGKQHSSITTTTICSIILSQIGALSNRYCRGETNPLTKWWPCTAWSSLTLCLSRTVELSPPGCDLETLENVFMVSTNPLWNVRSKSLLFLIQSQDLSISFLVLRRYRPSQKLDGGSEGGSNSSLHTTPEQSVAAQSQHHQQFIGEVTFNIIWV